MQRLTAVLLVLLARQGRHGVRRNDGGDHRRPRSRSPALEMQQGFWRRVTRWRGRRRRGGARRYIGEVRGRLWVRQRRAVATSSARLSRERDRGGDEHGGRSERGPGWRVASSRGAGEANQAGGGQARGRARRPHALVPTGTRRKTTGGKLGWASQLGRQLGRLKGQVTPSLSLSLYFLF